VVDDAFVARIQQRESDRGRFFPVVVDVVEVLLEELVQIFDMLWGVMVVPLVSKVGAQPLLVRS
jgi:hypothetical protein